MKASGLLLSFALVGVCLGAGQQPASKPPDTEPVYAGNTLSQWMALTQDEEQMVRSEAVVALGQLGPKGVLALAELLKSDATDLRFSAAMTLGRMGPKAKAAVPALVNALKDREWFVLGFVEEALRTWPGPRPSRADDVTEGQRLLGSEPGSRNSWKPRPQGDGRRPAR